MHTDVQADLSQAEDWSRMNKVYKEFFPVNYPACTGVVTGLISPEILVETECIAYKPSDFGY